MSKVKYLLFVFTFIVFAGCWGCKNRENYTERGVIIDPIENKNFVVLGWECIDKTDLVRIIVKHKENSKWQLVLLESNRSVPEIGEEVKVCFLQYFSDSRGKWENIPIIKH